MKRLGLQGTNRTQCLNVMTGHNLSSTISRPRTVAQRQQCASVKYLGPFHKCNVMHFTFCGFLKCLMSHTARSGGPLSVKTACPANHFIYGRGNWLFLTAISHLLVLTERSCLDFTQVLYVLPLFPIFALLRHFFHLLDVPFNASFWVSWLLLPTRYG